MEREFQTSSSPPEVDEWPYTYVMNWGSRLRPLQASC